MTVQLNHTIVHASDRWASARFFAEILGLAEPTTYGPFVAVQAGETTLDFDRDDGPIQAQHYAFLVSEPEFDEILGRVRERGLDFWADPGKQKPGEWNTEDGGRAFYWDAPDGHFLEVITVPYGGWPKA
jgi:catechol 2,3-dioxygenase-like lactoylglutathione lyase family enzyme